jgi:hypothetical protein
MGHSLSQIAFLVPYVGWRCRQFGGAGPVSVIARLERSEIHPYDVIWKLLCPLRRPGRISGVLELAGINNL